MNKIGKLLGATVLVNIALFCVFYFDLDGKLLFNVVEPFLKNHYDNIERRDPMSVAYDVNKYPKYEYEV